MAVREVGTGKLYASMEQAANAIANGDTIDVYAGATTTNQDLTHLASHTGWTIRNFQVARISVTLKANTMLKPGAGSASQIGSGSDFGFAITALGESGGNAGVCQIGSGGTLRFYDSTVTAINGNPCAVRVDAGASAATGYGYRSTFASYSSGTDGGVGLQVNGGSAACTFYAEGCTFSGGGNGVYAQSAARSALYAERCTFTATTGVFINGASTIDVRYSDFRGTTGVVHGAAGNPTVILWRNTWKCGTTEYSPNLGVSKSGVSVKGNWFYRMQVQQGAGLWNNNRYDTYITGAGLGTKGAQDAVCSLANAAFTNSAGGDFSLTSASQLINVGVDAAGQALDHDGLTAVKGTAADVGSHEYQFVDCGVDSMVQTGVRVARVTFIASPAGPQIPLQASAEDEANWLVSGDAGPLVLVTAVRVSDLVYDLTFDRDIEPGETIAVDSSAVTTDSGGLCDSPGIGGFASVWGGLASATMDDAETLRLTYINGGANTAPLEADALNIAKVVVAGALGGLTAVSIVKASAFVYLATLTRPTVDGEACTVDVSACATVGGGEVGAPSDLPFVGEQWPNGVAVKAEALSPTEIRVTFDDEAWLSWPSLGSAGQAASWTVRLKGGSASLVVASVRMESRYVYVLTLAVPMAVRPYEVVTDAVLTAHGGTCA